MSITTKLYHQFGYGGSDLTGDYAKAPPGAIAFNLHEALSGASDAPAKLELSKLFTAVVSEQPFSWWLVHADSISSLSPAGVPVWLGSHLTGPSILALGSSSSRSPSVHMTDFAGCGRVRLDPSSPLLLVLGFSAEHLGPVPTQIECTLEYSPGWTTVNLRTPGQKGTTPVR